ncbi:MAG: 2OG-Fe(II) oxygenase [Burkholderiales bacterium]
MAIRRSSTRELTYVYYFNHESKSFSGGELKLYDSRIENNYYVEAGSYKLIEPINNSMVFFLARYRHEVMPVSCPGKQFAHGRFTINGWARRK